MPLAPTQLSPDLKRILDEALSRPSLLGPMPEATEQETGPRYQPIRYTHTGGPAIPVKPHDPRSFAAVPQAPRSGWGNGVEQNACDTDEFRKLWERK